MRRALVVGFFGLLAATSQAQSLTAWGLDSSGTLYSAPSGNDFAKVSAGSSQGMALKTDGSLVTWGADYQGQVSNTPTGTGFTDVEVGFNYCMALRADGSIAAWGDDWWGKVSGTPLGTGFTELASSGFTSYALRADGSIAAWGKDNNGQVTGTPTATGFIQIAAGGESAAALRSDGSIVAWGRDYYGQVSGVLPGTGFKEIAVGSQCCFALRADGSIAGWGTDSESLLSTKPVGSGYKSLSIMDIAAGVIRADGAIICWGYDGYQQIYKAPKGIGFTQVNMGQTWGVALNGFDCNENGVYDPLDIAAGTSLDCNNNNLPDECDLLVYGADIDGDGQLDDCVAPPLMADTYELSVFAGGVQTFSMAAPVALDTYLLLGTTSGTAPGAQWESFLVPLNVDSYFMQTLQSPNAAPLANSIGTLTPAGTGGAGTVTFTLPANFDPSLVGMTLHHAYVTLDAASGLVAFVSNAVPLTLKP